MVGGGHFEALDPQLKSRWPKQVQHQVERTTQLGLVNISVDWQLHDDDAPRPLQAPSHMTSLFNGSRQVRRILFFYFPVNYDYLRK